VGWINKLVTAIKGPADELGGAAATPAPGARGTPPPAPTPAPTKGPRSSQQALSGYGNNPYDTYTWELHEAPDAERALKRTNDVGRKPKSGDKTNPYDTGAFRGGW
jgi:hypothetical protein